MSDTLQTRQAYRRRNGQGSGDKKSQVLSSLRESIIDRKIKPGEYLPTEKTLTEQHRLSRHHVREVLNQLAASGLVKRTPGKGTIVCDVAGATKSHTVVTMLHAHDWLGMGIMRGLAPTLRERNCRIEIIPAGFNEEEFSRNIEELLASRVDGAIVMPPPWLNRQEWVVRFKRAHIPLICLDTAPTEIAVPAVATDNTHGGRLAGEHLIACGYRRLYHLTHDNFGQTVQHRFNGFLQAVASQPMSVDVCLPLRFPFTEQAKHDATHPWLAAQQYWADFLTKIDPKDGPIGVFTGNDNEAYGVMLATQETTLAVGTDVGIVGFDNTDITRTTKPTITTLSQDPVRIGEIASDIMYEMLHNPEQSSHDRREYIRPELIVRESTVDIRQ